MHSFILALTGLCLSITPVFSASYSRVERITGADFYQAFDFETLDPDPTHGRVHYVDQVTAQVSNLTWTSPDTFIMRADSWTTLNPGDPGRRSVRLKSRRQYTTHVAVFDVRHAPTGCGTWPAIWETGGSWPAGGEVDIYEGVNDQPPNAVTLHTDAGCTMPSTGRTMTGTVTGNNCNVYETDNSGCGVQLGGSNTYGRGFNDAQGGWYVMERTNEAIKVWFWNRYDSSVPSEVVNGGSKVDTSSWGTPGAHFPNTSCSISSHFAAHSIIINLTFCGDWAGNWWVYSQSGCPSTCEDYVNKNPEAFREAYFDFRAVTVYE